MKTNRNNTKKCSHKKTDFFPFICDDKLRLMSFWMGFSMLILWAITFIASWISDSNMILNGIAKLSKETKENLINANIYPSISGAFLQVRFTFTYISNIWIGIALLLYGIFPKYLWSKRFLFLSTVYITITFIGFWGVIIPFIFINPEFWYQIPLSWKILTVPVHFINPVIAFVAIILLRKRMVVSKKTMNLSFLMVLGYYIFTMLIFFIGVKDVDVFLSDIKIKNSVGLDIYSKMQVSIYPFLNFRRPFGYEGNNLFIKIILNLIIPIGGIAISFAVSYFWQKVLKIKLYDKKILNDKNFLEDNVLLFKK